MYILEGVEKTSKDTLQKISQINDLFKKTKIKIKEEAPKIYSYELLEILFTQVYCKYSILLEKGIVKSRNTASKYLNKLVDIDILEKEKLEKEFIFKNKALYDLFKEG